MNETDERYMRLALEQAKLAEKLGEIPVGAVIVKDGAVIAAAYNRRETDHLATAHAELLAIETACRTVGGWRLHGCTLYVTLEPCPMCAGAIINARLDRVVYGAKDPKAGVCGTMANLFEMGFNHRPILKSGILETECSEQLSRFFEKLRNK